MILLWPQFLHLQKLFLWFWMPVNFTQNKFERLATNIRWKRSNWIFLPFTKRDTWHCTKMCLDIRIVTCGPNEAIIISGVFYSPPTMIVGGRAIICPCIHKVQKLQLSTMTLIIESKKVYTAQGVPVSVTGVAQVKYSCAQPGNLTMQF